MRSVPCATLGALMMFACARDRDVPQPPAQQQTATSASGRTPELSAIVYRVLPVIPDALLPAAPAKVTVQMDINADGNVTGVEVLQSDLPKVNGLFVDACMKWRFKPSGHAQQLIFHRLVLPKATH